MRQNHFTTSTILWVDPFFFVHFLCGCYERCKRLLKRLYRGNIFKMCILFFCRIYELSYSETMNTARVAIYRESFPSNTYSYIHTFNNLTAINSAFKVFIATSKISFYSLVASNLACWIFKANFEALTKPQMIQKEMKRNWVVQYYSCVSAGQYSPL